MIQFKTFVRFRISVSSEEIQILSALQYKHVMHCNANLNIFIASQTRPKSNMSDMSRLLLKERNYLWNNQLIDVMTQCVTTNCKNVRRIYNDNCIKTRVVYKSDHTLNISASCWQPRYRLQWERWVCLRIVIKYL